MYQVCFLNDFNIVDNTILDEEHMSLFGKYYQIIWVNKIK